MRRRLSLLLLPFAAAAATAGNMPYRKTLTDVRRSLSTPAWQISGREATPDCPTPWAIRKSTLRGGKQEGVEVIEVDNGKLRFLVIPTRGMGILHATMGDLRLGWESPIKELVHPQFVNLQARGGLGWLDGFNEWMVRCGLENNGGPGTDKFINNVGAEATMEVTLHGKIANLPAHEVEVLVDRQPPYRIRIRGIVNERMFHGPKLELSTQISTEPGSSSIRVSDVVTNRGGTPQEFQMLYHANYGRPLLGDGAKVLVPAARVTPFNELAAKSISTWSTYSGPTPGAIESVYALRLNGDSEGRTLIALQNAAADRAVSMAYSLKELPYTSVWKNPVAVEDGYVTGLEPGTNFPNTRRLERKAGRVPKLPAGGEYRMTIDYGLHIGKEAVKQVADRIATIQGDKLTKLDSEPEKLE